MTVSAETIAIVDELLRYLDGQRAKTYAEKAPILRYLAAAESAEPDARHRDGISRERARIIHDLQESVRPIERQIIAIHKLADAAIPRPIMVRFGT